MYPLTWWNVMDASSVTWSDLCARWRNLPTASCRMSELKNSRHSKCSIVCSRIGSRRGNRRVSGPDRLALSTASTWIKEAKTRAGGKITDSIAKSLPTEVEKFWRMSARCRDSANSRCNFLRSRHFSRRCQEVFFQRWILWREKAFLAKLIFAGRRRGAQAATQEIAEAVRVLLHSRSVHSRSNCCQTPGGKK